MITKTWKDVYDSIVEVSHTGDVVWQTALNITSKGKGQIIFEAVAAAQGEIRITLDGNVLINGIPGRGSIYDCFYFEFEWEITCLIEYRVNNAAATAWLEIVYF